MLGGLIEEEGVSFRMSFTEIEVIGGMDTCKGVEVTEVTVTFSTGGGGGIARVEIVLTSNWVEVDSPEWVGEEAGILRSGS